MRTSTAWWRVLSSSPWPAARPRADRPPPGASPPSELRPALWRWLPAAAAPLVARLAALMDARAAARPTAPAAAVAAACASRTSEATGGDMGTTPAVRERAGPTPASARPAATASAAVATKADPAVPGTEVAEAEGDDKTETSLEARTEAAAPAAVPTRSVEEGAATRRAAVASADATPGGRAAPAAACASGMTLPDGMLAHARGARR